MKTETTVGFFVLAAIGLFFCMIFFLGIWRFDRSSYVPYTVMVTDSAGLAVKAEVKVAGVTIGWIDKVDLCYTDRRVKLVVMLKKDCIVHADAHALARQDSLLGTKYLELTPGSLDIAVLQPGGTIAGPSREPVSFDTLLQQMSILAQNVTLLTQRVDTMVESNQEQIARLLNNVTTIVDDLRRTLPQLGGDISAVTDQLYRDILPGLQRTMNAAVSSFDCHAGKVADAVQAAVDSPL